MTKASMEPEIATSADLAASRDADVLAPVLRIAPGATGVSIWSDALFASATPAQLREFLSRVFSVGDVAAVEIHRDEAYGRIHYGVLGDPTSIWRKLSQAIRQSVTEPKTQPCRGATASAQALYLDGPSNLPIEITRIGASLSTWRVRHLTTRRVRLSHPILRRRRDVAYRLEEALTSVLGVQRCRTSTVSGCVAIRIDAAVISPERLIRQIEQFWPVLLGGLDGPPSNKRLLAATGLFGLAATGQFFVPALRPLGVLGVAIYGFPNVTTAFRQLLRGQVGLPALYSFGLGLMLLSGMPFNSTLFAVLMQSWPRLAHGTLSQSQRRLFAAHRQQSTWARLRLGHGADIEVDVASLRNGDIVSIRKGDVVPVDGLVVEGLAAIDEETLSGVAGAVDKAPGDPVHATAYVRDGHVLVRVASTGPDAVAHQIACVLPHAGSDALPSALEAERIANRNAKPALALAVASLFSRRLVRPSQAIIRPDYITAHRLGAQLAALHDLGNALHQGILFRRPGGLDLLAATDVYVIDQSDALLRRRIEIAEVFAAKDVLVSDVIRLAAAAFPALQNERVRVVHDRCAEIGVAIPQIFRRRRVAGAVLYDDERGHHVEIGSAALYTNAKNAQDLRNAVKSSAHEASFDPARWPEDHLLRPLIVRRDGEVIGAVAFHRAGDFEAAETFEHLRAINRQARFIHVSSRSQAEAEAVAANLGIETAVGGLDEMEKARITRELGPRTLWVGDGARAESGPAIGAAGVSISVAGFQTVGRDRADIVFLQPSLLSLLPLRRIAGEHRAWLDGDYRAIYAVNLFGVAGGIFGNFGGLQAGVISNVGTAYVYLQHRRRLRDLVARFENRRALLVTPGREDEGRLFDKISIRASDAERYVDAPHHTASNQPTEEAEGV